MKQIYGEIGEEKKIVRWLGMFSDPLGTVFHSWWPRKFKNRQPTKTRLFTFWYHLFRTNRCSFRGKFFRCFEKLLKLEIYCRFSLNCAEFVCIPWISLLTINSLNRHDWRRGFKSILDSTKFLLRLHWSIISVECAFRRVMSRLQLAVSTQNFKLAVTSFTKDPLLITLYGKENFLSLLNEKKFRVTFNPSF